MSNERISRSFWIITDQHEVEEVTGYECPNDSKNWYFPGQGTLVEDVHCFVSRGAAVSKAKESLNRFIALYQGRLAALQD